MTITSLDGYRWLKNDIIRGNFQPDEKLRMSLLTSRYALGVGPLREALSQLVAERLVTVVKQNINNERPTEPFTEQHAERRQNDGDDDSPETHMYSL